MQGDHFTSQVREITAAKESNFLLFSLFDFQLKNNVLLQKPDMPINHVISHLGSEPLSVVIPVF